MGNIFSFMKLIAICAAAMAVSTDQVPENNLIDIGEEVPEAELAEVQEAEEDPDQAMELLEEDEDRRWGLSKKVLARLRKRMMRRYKRVCRKIRRCRRYGKKLRCRSYRRCRWVKKTRPHKKGYKYMCRRKRSCRGRRCRLLRTCRRSRCFWRRIGRKWGRRCMRGRC